MTQLTYPTIAAIIDELKPEVLSNGHGLNNMVKKFMIGDMMPHYALDKFTDGTLMIVPGNREGVILTALTEHLMKDEIKKQVSGIIFTDDVAPHPKNLIVTSKTKHSVITSKKRCLFYCD